MKVSIITVCYNSEKTIRDTIKSVLDQNYAEVEYIIVDGQSTDNTRKIIEDYRDKIHTIISEPDCGIYDAMNKGFRYSTGDVVGILNSDDFFANSQVISDVVQHFKSNLKTSCVFGDVVFVDPDELLKETRFYSSKGFKSWKLRFGWMPPHPATFLKRSVFEKVGEYALDYKISADYEFFVRVFMVHRVAYSRIDKVLVKMRTGGISTSGLKSKLLLNYEIVKACKTNGIYTNFFFLMFKVPFKMLELIKKTKN